MWRELNSTAYEGPEDFSKNNSFHSVGRRVETLVSHYRLQVNPGSCPLSLNSGIPLGFELWITSWHTHTCVQSWRCCPKPHPPTAQRKRIVSPLLPASLCITYVVRLFGFCFHGILSWFTFKKFSCFQTFDLRWIFLDWKPPQEKFCVLLSFTLTSNVAEAGSLHACLLRYLCLKTSLPGSKVIRMFAGRAAPNQRNWQRAKNGVHLDLNC